MAPRPSSQKEPSSRRSILKSPKRDASAGPNSAAGGGLRPARTKQTAQTPFTFRRSPQVEQIETDTARVSIVGTPLSSASTPAKVRGAHRPLVPRSPQFGEPRFSTHHGNALAAG